MNNDGFLLYDSLLAIVIFTAIVLMLPGIFYIISADELSTEQLNVYRELYIMSTRYDSAEDYIQAAQKFFDGTGMPCDERLKKYAADGFSYMEILLSLMTAGLIMAAMPNIMMMFQSLTLHEDYYDTDIFTLDIIETYKAAEEIKIIGRSINFTTDSGEVSYRFADGRIIKSINGDGFVTLMYNIGEFIITEKDKTIILKLKGAANETFTFRQ